MRWLALVILLVPTLAHAHGSVSARIDDVSRRLHQRPNDAELLADRGALYAVDRRWTDAVQDFEDAYELDPRLEGIEHRLGNALLNIGEADRAIELLSNLLRRDPHHVDARLVRARAYLHIGEIDKAVADYDHAIARSERPAPRYYRERAQALADQGRIDEALAGLHAGIAELGPIVSLVEPAIDHEVARGRYDQALAMADRLAPALRDSPDWRARRASWLQRAGRHDEAREQYQRALETLAQLPASRRASAAMTDLEARIRRELQSLEVVPAPLAGGAPLWLALVFVCALVVLVRRYSRFSTASMRSIAS